MQRAAGVGGQADHVAGVRRDLGLHEDDVEHVRDCRRSQAPVASVRGARRAGDDPDLRPARAPACSSTRADLADRGAGRHHVVDQRDGRGRAARHAAGFDRKRRAHIGRPAARAAGRAGAACLSCAAATARRWAAEARAPAGAPAPRPGCSRVRAAAAALSGTGSSRPGAGVGALRCGVEQALRPAPGQVERGVELELRDQAVPGVGVVDAPRCVRRTAAGRSGTRRRSARPAGTSIAQRHSAARVGANRATQCRRHTPLLAPAAAHRALAGQAATASSRRCEQAPRQYTGRHDAELRYRRRRRLDAMAVNAALRRMARARRSALAARRSGAAHGRAAAASIAAQTRTRARLVGLARGRRFGAGTGLPEGSALRSSSRTPNGPSAAATPRRRPWWSAAALAAAPVAGGADQTHALPPRRTAGLGQHDAARRRRPTGAVRALAASARASMAS